MKELKKLLKEYKENELNIFYMEMNDIFTERQKDIYDLLEIRQMYLRIIILAKFNERGLI